MQLAPRIARAIGSHALPHALPGAPRFLLAAAGARPARTAAPRARAAATAASAGSMAQQQQQAPPAGAPPPPADARLAAVRAAMAAPADGGAPLAAFIIPSEDPHMSEYPPAADARRAWATGFDGSAGTAVVTPDAALLWTDGRYFLQAEAQLRPGWGLMRAGEPGTPEIADWLAAAVPEGGRVGIDPALHTIDAAEKLRATLAAAGVDLAPLAPGANPVDAAWAAAGGRPPPPAARVRRHPERWAGQSAADKLGALRAELAKHGAGGLLVTGLDEVAWLLNLRGADVDHNPVFVAYALVAPEAADGAGGAGLQTAVYVDAAKLTPEAAAALAEARVAVKPYGAALADVRAAAAAGARLWMDPAKVAYAFKAAALEAAAAAAAGRKRPRAEGDGGAAAAPKPPRAAAVVLERASPVGLAKALKNDAELAGLREAHARDGVALARFLCWLERAVEAQAAAARGAPPPLTELDVDRELAARRAEQEGFVEPSFPTIAGAGPNGAVIHYRPTAESAAPVGPGTLLLLDSGGQYDCGTTDVTRTLLLGGRAHAPTPHQRACFTAVLRGHIALDRAVYPQGTPGCAIDAFARAPLWALGLNYRHGTGHGVGAALNVHEGPQSIAARFANTQGLLPRMVCSNEPGYYEDGAFGIRVENLFVVEEAPTPHAFGGPYLRHANLTLVPLQRKMIDAHALSPAERAWVDEYHASVWAGVAPRLEAAGHAEELEWLRAATAPL